MLPEKSKSFPGGSVVKNLPAMQQLHEMTHGLTPGFQGSIPGLRRSSGGGHGNPLKYSCLGNPLVRGAWQSIGSKRVRYDRSDLACPERVNLGCEAINQGDIFLFSGWCLRIIM